ncbi:MAG: glycosyltransferase family 2 protein [Chloroflexi bacterium]|nr:glycosyltransferase family 2 protein [Chloroflexota bacterium]
MMFQLRLGITMISQNANQSQPSMEALWRLARVWYKKGNIAQAVSYYRKILTVVPSKKEVFVELADLLMAQGDWAAVADACQAWLAEFPENSMHGYSNEVHKLYINALVQQSGIAAAFAAYQLIRQDRNTIDLAPDDLLCCAVMRNEAMRLPYFLDYYRRQGIAKFFIIDNDSTDGTLAYLLTQSDVYTWHSTTSFKQANCGAAWWELLLRSYGVGHWVLVVDADELLYYPLCEERTLAHLCAELAAEGKSAYKAIMLDMYSDQPIEATHYRPGTDFLAVCPYFDRQYYHLKRPFDGPFENMTNYWGGVRTRVFGGNHSGYLLNKVPLFIYRADDVLTSGQHWIKRPLDEISNQRGALLHFKYFSSFAGYVKQEVMRKEHARQAAAYQIYASQLAADEALTLYDPLHSVRFENSMQLARLGIIQGSCQAAAHSLPPKDHYFPPIAPLSSTILRPFWSVMIAVDEHSQALGRTLQSVAAQFSQAEEVQIEIVYDRTSQHIASEIAKLVAQIADARVQVHESSRYLGHSGLLTLCIERAQGQWVHLLAGDDWLSPGFYKALAAGIERAPEMGGAFCRFDYKNVDGKNVDGENSRAGQRVLAPLECATAGPLVDWLPRIAVQDRVALSALVVKRTVYEQVGGFCLAAGSAATWEMGQRIAQQGCVWYEPQTLAHTADKPHAINYQCYSSGLPLAHALAAIEIASCYLPTDLGAGLTQQAREAVAAQAIKLAQMYLAQGDYRAALANLGEGLRADTIDSPEVNRKLLTLFSQIVT